MHTTKKYWNSLFLLTALLGGANLYGQRCPKVKAYHGNNVPVQRYPYAMSAIVTQIMAS